MVGLDRFYLNKLNLPSYLDFSLVLTTMREIQIPSLIFQRNLMSLESAAQLDCAVVF